MGRSSIWCSIPCTWNFLLSKPTIQFLLFGTPGCESEQSRATRAAQQEKKAAEKGRLFCYFGEFIVDFSPFLRRNRLRCRHFHRCKPAKTIRFQPVGNGEKLIGDLLRDLAGLSVGYHDSIDRPDRRHLSGGSGEEYLVCDVEHLAGNRLLGHRQAQVP